jgi:hypothetical protein
VAIGFQDHTFRNANGTMIVREGSGPSPWLVTWLPDDENDPGYPGVTLSSTEGQVPYGPTVEAVVEWAAKQPWANQGAPPNLAGALDVPKDEWADLQHRAYEHGVRLVYTQEPDGGFSWALISLDGNTVMQQGTADNWDDARLDMISNLYPPSRER